MRLPRIVGAGILVVLMGAAMASTASAAAPEFGRCVKVAKGAGTYATAKCTEAGGERKFEWIPGPGADNHFKTAVQLFAVVQWQTSLKGSAAKLECKGETGSGEVSGTKTVGNVEMLFTGCKSDALSCSNTEVLGDVLVKGITGGLGIIKKGETAAKDKLGMDLDISFEAECGFPVAVRDSVIVPVKTNAMLFSETMKFTGKNGKQNPEQFEGEAKDVPEFSKAGGPFEPAGFALTVTRTNEERLEINSVV